ncbi:MAG: glycosyltransferase family 2 protein [Schwartzia sp.]|nr:glycosyltransferase family 2 protein [Schwartzia sp. (in: firmicutes)]
MKLSVCYIVKNEEKNLPLSLETVKEFADELIVVDTGSTDATKKIALDAGATVLDFVWRDDFAAARNFALDRATGDWIVFPDADEGFLTPEKVRGKISEIDAMQPPIDAVMVTLIEIDEKKGLETGKLHAIRFFRHSPEIHYKGRIHENIAHNSGKLRLYHDDGALSLYHTGYAKDVLNQKSERNLRLLLNDIEKNGEQPGQYLYLADCYLNLRDFPKAMKYAVLALDSPVQPTASRAGLYHVAIESMRQLDWPLDEQLALANKAQAEYPKQPEFYGERGMILCALGRLEEARASLCRSIEIYEKKETPATAETYFNDETAELVRKRIKEIDAVS